MKDASLEYPDRESDYTFGFDYLINENFSVGLSHERGGYSSIRFTYKNNPKDQLKNMSIKRLKYLLMMINILRLIKNLEENDIGVNKITETSNSIGLDLTQFIHPDLNLLKKLFLNQQ